MVHQSPYGSITQSTIQYVDEIRHSSWEGIMRLWQSQFLSLYLKIMAWSRSYGKWVYGLNIISNNVKYWQFHLILFTTKKTKKYNEDILYL